MDSRGVGPYQTPNSSGNINSHQHHYVHYQQAGGRPPLLPQKPQLLLLRPTRDSLSSSPWTEGYRSSSLGGGVPKSRSSEENHYSSSLHYEETALFNQQAHNNNNNNNNNSPDYSATDHNPHYYHHYHQQQSAFRPVYRRLSLVGAEGYFPNEMADSDSSYGTSHSIANVSMSASMTEGGQSHRRRRETLLDGKSTLSRKAQKIAQRAQKLTIASIGSELTNSASALYSSLFNPGDGGGYASPVAHNNPPISSGAASATSTFYSAHEQFLTDQTEVVSVHIQKGIDFLERYSQFVKDRACIEEEYAAKLKSLAKKARGKKSDDGDSNSYSYMTAFYSMLDEINFLAAQHEVVAERMKKEVVPSVMDKCQSLRAGRKRQMQELGAINMHVNIQIEAMTKQQRNYGFRKTFQESEQAFLKHKKAFDNERLPRIEVNKASDNANMRLDICERAKQSYADALENANKAQHEYFSSKLPTLLEQMRQLDVDRIDSTQKAMLQSIEAETGVLKIINRCYEDMQGAVKKIDPQRDTVVVVEQNKTGYAHPENYQFRDLGNPRDILETMQDNGGQMHSHGSATLTKRNAFSSAQSENSVRNGNGGKGVARKSSMHQRIFGAGSSSANDGEYGNLPPQQQCRHLHKKLKELGKEVETKQQSRAGLEKMYGVYKDNPNMGDVKAVEQQMKTVTDELTTLRISMDKYKKLLAHAESKLDVPVNAVHHQAPPPTTGPGSFNSSADSSPRASANPSLLSAQINQIGNGSVDQQRSSYSGESLASDGRSSLVGASKVAPFTHFSPPAAPANNTTQQTNGINGHGAQSRPPGAHMGAKSSPSSNDFYEECDPPSSQAAVADLPVLGTCSALFDYEGNTTDGTTISMKKNDEMVILERDEGDGWTHVRHINTQVDGFVPSSYLVLRFYPPLS